MGQNTTINKKDNQENKKIYCCSTANPGLPRSSEVKELQYPLLLCNLHSLLLLTSEDPI